MLGVSSLRVHESINSLGVLIGIALGGVSLYLQLAPKESEVSFSPATVVTTDDRLELRPYPSKPDQELFGPITWKLIINNDSDRAISIVRNDLPTIEVGDDRFYTTGIFDGIFELDGSSISYPLTIQAFESKAVAVRGYLPTGDMSPARKTCVGKNLAVSDYMQCMIHEGTDAFGNDLEVTRLDGRFVGASWPMDSIQPKLEMNFVTSDEREFRTQLRVYPVGN